MNILLTGSGGFIGSYILKSLLSENHKVLIILRKPIEKYFRISNLRNHNNLNIMYNDLTRLDKNFNQLKSYNIDVIIHLAWFGVKNIYKDDNKQDINKIITNKIIDISNQLMIKKLICFGSQAEYGLSDKIINENLIEKPITKYGKEKLISLNLIKKKINKSINFIWLRIFSTYGPMDDESWFLSYLIRSILKKNSIKMTKGDQIWDYLYVEEVADVIILILKNDISDGVYNLGSGNKITIKQIVNKVSILANNSSDIKFGAIPYSKNQIMHLEADIQKISKALNWKPKVDLEYGLKKTIDWWKKNID